MWWRNLAWRPRLSQDDGHRPCQLWYPSSRSWSNDVDLGALNQPASRRVGHFHPRMQLALIDKLKLLSSVVSVLISLISDTWPIGSHDIKLIFLGGVPITVACYWGSRASPLRCTTASAWRTPTQF
ncbi:hypothetical protein I3842_02G097200 [Carya illinoinensis]|uniref:Uncharacterized protein n=1 Tax=Carya illinoinensis TaxID=32201 RepID=A0A922JZC8_CARIL|nr:hypothetical protein I3842_02G097200 [Carya illinoinensis]